jgi:uncharacterized protein YndB with AHSA1/START domain
MAVESGGTPDDEIVITRVINAPRALVFAAWTDPEHLAQWWGPHAVTHSVCDIDLRPGGAYRIVMRMPDGVEYPLTGVYREIVAPERLVMTMDASGHPAAWHDMVNPHRQQGEDNPAGEMLQTVTFDDVGGKTRLTVRIRLESSAIRDAMVRMGMNEGWSQSLDRLEALLGHVAASAADQEIVTTRVLDAPRALVFEAWTNPAHVAHWWGPNGFTTTVHEMDVRPGGAWCFVMHGRDGTNYRNDIVFVEVVKPERLVYDHGPTPRFRTTVTFDEHGDRTTVTMRARFETVRDDDAAVNTFKAIEGASQHLGRLKEYLAKM